jgi:hypothetical protein
MNFPLAEEICIQFKVFGPVLLLLMALLVASALPSKFRGTIKLEKLFNGIAKRKRLAVFLVGLITFVGAAIVSTKILWPVPKMHDEFSYLLAADTFAHWRLTNPTIPMWEHFETFHVLHNPSYVSKYLPGQGLILAFGQILVGYPIVGVWLSMALACAATCWMLQAWLPPRWAFLGALIMVLRLGIFTYWSQGYWGGAVPALGGALVLGAMRRLLKKTTANNSLILGLGLSILAISRPFEGGIVSFCVLIFLIFWFLVKAKHSTKALVKSVIFPLAIVLTTTALLMFYYNWRTTGSPFLLAYQLYENAYGNLPVFIWSNPPKPIVYNHREMEEFYQGWSYDRYKEVTSDWYSFSSATLEKIKQLWAFFLGGVFIFPLLILPFTLKNFWSRLALWFFLALSCPIIFLEVFCASHYFAPGVCLLYFLLAQSMRRLYLFKWKKKPIGKFVVWSIPSYCILLIFIPIFLRQNPLFYVNPSVFEPTKVVNSWIKYRTALLGLVEAEEGKHLIIVRYLPNHNVHQEWVYNLADLDNSKILWARAINREKDCELIKYYSDRKVWFVEVGKKVNFSSYESSSNNLCK